jgi:hypothetical protein
VVQVRHRQPDLDDVLELREDGAAHREQRLLQRERVGRREGREQRLEPAAPSSTWVVT